MGSPQPQFDNAWDIYLRMRDALRAVTRHETLQQILSNVSSICEPQNCLDVIPGDLQPNEDDLLIVDESDDEGSISAVDLTEDNSEEGHASEAVVDSDFL